MSTPIPIVGDTPSLDPQLGFDAYATALVDAIRGGSPARFTIGIYGPWGSGKSSLLNAIASHLDEVPDIVTVPFDAWRYESSGQIIVPLLHAIYERVGEFRSAAITAKVGEALKSIVRSLTLTVGPLAINGADLFGPNAKDDEIVALDMAFAKPYKDMRAISAELGDRRIVVLVDDLDRCSPGKVVSLLEAINLVMDIDGFIFVLALDYDVLAKAVAHRYPYASGHVFIEKMIQVPFRVPRLELPKHNFLQQLIPDWEERSQSLPDDFEQIAYDVATLGLDANPRQIKRLLNSVLVLLNVAKRHSLQVDVRLLAGVVGMQLRWPAEYSDFVEAVLAGDQHPLAPITANEETGTARYAEQFFKSGISADDLRPYVQLTQTVAVSMETPAATDDVALAVVPGDPDVMAVAFSGAVRDANTLLLTRLLGQEGYVQKTPGVYTTSRVPEIRFRFGKTVIRCEIRDAGESKWVLYRSLDLSTEYELASNLIIKPTAIPT